ncbi:MAG: acyl-CoA N-acyltransferase [Thermodesulfobacteriota bacterium]
MTNLTIEPVETRRQFREFVDLPWSIYPSYPHWVPPLKSEVRRLLDARRHPFWKSAERVLFLARRGSRLVGRIAAIVDHNSNTYHSEKAGAWGFFESVDEPAVATALFEAVEDWTTHAGMEFVRGPLNPSTNYEIGLLVEGFEYDPAIMMPYNPSYYMPLVESCGYTKEKDVLAFVTEHTDRGSERVERLARRVVRKTRASIRTIDMKNLPAEVDLMRELYNQAWAHNWGFCPTTDDEAKEMAAGLRKIVDPDLAFFVYYQGEPVGICLIMPDVNPLIKRLNGKIGLLGVFKYLAYRKEVVGSRLLAIGFRQDHHKLGLPIVAFEYVNRVGRAKGLKYMELSWTLEDNEAINQYAAEMGGKLRKRYRIFRKELNTGRKA